MAEPRARVRQKGQVFSTGDCTYHSTYRLGSTDICAVSEYLTAFAAPNPPHLPSTITVLDEILTDFIIETCHAAALCASYSRRQKIKVDDFKWVLRRDPRLLGRVQEQQWRDKKMKEQRKGIDVEKLGAEGGVADLAALVGDGGADKSEAGKKRGRKKRKAEDEAGGPAKKPHL